MATMKQVAQLAGVSNATVSHVVNGTKQLSAATTRRVRQAMKELGYRPRRDMGGARTRLKAIGVLVEDMRCFPVPDVLCGIAEALEPAGYQILLHDLHLYEKLYNQYELIGAYREEVNQGVDALVEAGVSGVIYAAMHDRHLDGLLDKVPCPLVYAYSLGSADDFFVTYGNKEAAADVARHFIALGHRRIAVIAGHPHSFPAMKRLNGFQIALQEVGLAIPEGFLAYGNWEYSSGYEQMKRMLGLPQRPTAVFVMNDYMAAGALHALQDAGLEVPLDVSLVGFDHRDACDYLRPRLSTVDLPVREIGRQAAGMVKKLVAAPDTTPYSIILPCRLMERASVAPPK